MAPRRWLLFALSVGSLGLLAYAAVLVAFSVAVTPTIAAANPGLEPGARAVLVPLTDPTLVPTHATDDEAALLAAAGRKGSVPAGATNVTLGRALAYVSPGANGSYEGGNITLVDVPSANGTVNLTLDVAQLANGSAGWLVMGANESEPRFVPATSALGHVSRTESSGTLGLLVASGSLGFVAPLVALVLTHRGAGQKGVSESLCRECSAPLAAGESFCTRCGAWRANKET